MFSLLAQRSARPARRQCGCWSIHSHPAKNGIYYEASWNIVPYHGMPWCRRVSWEFFGRHGISWNIVWTVKFCRTNVQSLNQPATATLTLIREETLIMIYNCLKRCFSMVARIVLHLLLISAYSFHVRQLESNSHDYYL